MKVAEGSTAGTTGRTLRRCVIEAPALRARTAGAVCIVASVVIVATHNAPIVKDNQRIRPNAYRFHNYKMPQR